MSPQSALPACRPKCFAFRYPSAHQSAKNDYQSFSSRVLPSQGSNPFFFEKAKKKHYLTVMLLGGEKGISPQSALPACRPKCFAFRCPSTHQSAKNDYQSFSSRVLPSQGSNPFSFEKAKKKHYLTVMLLGGEKGIRTLERD